MSLNVAMPSYVSASDSINLSPPETQALIEELKACDQALKDSQAEAAKTEFVATKQEERIKATDARVIELEKDRDSFARNPTLWFVVGMLTAGLTAALVRK